MTLYVPCVYDAIIMIINSPLRSHASDKMKQCCPMPSSKFERVVGLYSFRSSTDEGVYARR